MVSQLGLQIPICFWLGTASSTKLLSACPAPAGRVECFVHRAGGLARSLFHVFLLSWRKQQRWRYLTLSLSKSQILIFAIIIMALAKATTKCWGKIWKPCSTVCGTCSEVVRVVAEVVTKGITVTTGTEDASCSEFLQGLMTPKTPERGGKEKQRGTMRWRWFLSLFTLSLGFGLDAIRGCYQIVVPVLSSGVKSSILNTWEP